MNTPTPATGLPPRTLAPTFAVDDNGVWTLTVPGVCTATGANRDQVIDETHQHLRRWAEGWFKDRQVRVDTGADGRRLADFLARADAYRIDAWLESGRT